MVEELGLYVHWPWCVRKCPYCDFNSFAAPACVPESRYIDALVADLKYSSGAVAGRTVTSVFFGGGTPSLMSERSLTRVLEAVAQYASLAPEAEITLEANPGTLEADRFRAYARAGVNRLSIGVQSFNDTLLGRLGRIHSAAEAHRAIAVAGELFENVNLDVMFALPGQTISELDEEIDQALRAQTTHLSFYELTIEEGTAFFKRPPQQLPSGDAAADMADRVHERLTAAGFDHYEISGYARLGHRCRHNLTYWTFGDYLGIGAGAHAKVTHGEESVRTVRASQPLRYMELAEKGIFDAQRRTIGSADVAFEFMLNALRLQQGVPAQRWQDTTGWPLSSLEPVLTELRAQGLLTQDVGRIQASERGRLFLSDVQERFLTLDVAHP